MTTALVRAGSESGRGARLVRAELPGFLLWPIAKAHLTGCLGRTAWCGIQRCVFAILGWQNLNIASSFFNSVRCAQAALGLRNKKRRSNGFFLESPCIQQSNRLWPVYIAGNWRSPGRCTLMNIVKQITNRQIFTYLILITTLRGKYSFPFYL